MKVASPSLNQGGKARTRQLPSDQGQAGGEGREFQGKDLAELAEKGLPDENS